MKTINHNFQKFLYKFMIKIYRYFSTMKGIQVKNFGGPKVLKLQEINVPIFSRSEVLIKVMSAGVNPVDTYIRDGQFLVLPELPYTPGKDCAGIVEKVGGDVKKYQKGQRVFVCGSHIQHGTYAEFCVADEKNTFPLDDCLDFNQGAALGIPYFTAHRALFIKGQAKAGETVLIHGASGAVGLAAVQLARKHKMVVYGTAGTTEGLELVKENGANYVYCHKDKNYTSDILEQTENKGIDLIIEMLANVNLDKDIDLLARGGRIMVVGSRGPADMDPRGLMGSEKSIMGVHVFNSTKDEWQITSGAILKGVKEGYIKPVVAKCYSLEKANDAHHDIIKSKGAKGKLVITVSS